MPQASPYNELTPQQTEDSKMSKVTIASVIRTAIVEGKSTSEILEIVKGIFPEANTSAACVAYYRSKAKKEGKLPAKKEAKAAPVVKQPAAKPTALHYTVKGITTFNGMEGSGYNASIYRDGVRVAYVIDDASGGPLMIDWLDKEVECWECLDYKGTPFMYKGTAEEKLMYDYTKSLPAHECDFLDSDGQPVMMDWTIDLFMDELVNTQITFNKFKKDMKKSVLYRAKNGDLMKVNAQGNPNLYNNLRVKYGATVILNELSDEQLMVEVKRV